MSVIFNFATYDKKATIQNVKRFFREDVDHLEQLAGVSLSSIQLDQTGVKSQGLNGQETRMIKAVDARRELRTIKQAVEQCTELHQTLIDQFFLYRRPAYAIGAAIGYGRTTTIKKINNACYDFATRYAELGYDLRVKTSDTAN